MNGWIFVNNLTNNNLLNKSNYWEESIALITTTKRLQIIIIIVSTSIIIIILFLLWFPLYWLIIIIKILSNLCFFLFSSLKRETRFIFIELNKLLWKLNQQVLLIDKFEWICILFILEGKKKVYPILIYSISMIIDVRFVKSVVNKPRIIIIFVSKSVLSL